MQGEGTERMKVKLGGEMYQAGPANVLGKFCPKFERVKIYRLPALLQSN